MIHEFLHARPQIHESCFIAPGADVIGDVTIQSESSIWFNATVRGDVNFIDIGSRSNIQDNACVHVTSRTHLVQIGSRVTIGHGAVIHGCTIHDRVLVGISSVILDGAIIEPDCMIAAGSLVPPGKIMPSGYLCMGSPAKPTRKLTREETESLITAADNYVTYLRAWQKKDSYDQNPFYSR